MGMKKNSVLIVLFLATACSSSKWVVENQFEIDRNDFELVDSKQFLQRIGTISPENPIIQFELLAANTFKYTQRVRTDRYIQRYKPSLGSILLGVAGGGLAYASAVYAEDVSSGDSRNTELILYSTAGLITLSSLLNVKPSGEANPTGEVRLLRKTGEVTEIDTVRSEPLNNVDVSYTIYFDGEIIAFGNDLEYRNNRYTINLLEGFNPEEAEYSLDDVVTLEIYFNDDIYINTIPISSFLERFVVITSEITALRDEPELNTRTVLTDLARGSQLKYLSSLENWYKVNYGISETYISKTDAQLIWRPSEFASQLSIITVPNIPFGNIDVESEIPALIDRTENAYGFIIANREYMGSYSERIYAERDAELISTYLNKSFGYRTNNVRVSTNIENQQQLELAYNRLANNIRREQDKLVIYLSGYVEAGENGEIELIGTGNTLSRNINLNAFFNGVLQLPFKELIILLDIDNVSNIKTKIIEPLADQILDKNENIALLVSSTETQRSRDYTSSSGEQKRHSIFSYFIADAIKKGATDVSSILNHLQRNVDYTSRRLHDEPQHILFFGNSELSFIH